MTLIEDLQFQISAIQNQISQVIPQTRTIEIRRDQCITVGSQFAAKSSVSQVCRETPIIESYFDQNQQSILRPLNETLTNLQQQLAVAASPKSTAPQTQIEIPKINDTAASPNALSLGIPGAIVIAGIIGLFILGRKN